MKRALGIIVVAVIVAVAILWPRGESPGDYDAAKRLFEEAVSAHNAVPTAATEEARDTKFEEAATGYRRVLSKYPKQTFWCAQALRSLGNVRATQGEIGAALKLYDRVAEDYPDEDWEALQALKSAGDLCRDNARGDEARAYYQRIVNDFADAEAPMMKTIVKAAQRQLASD